MTIKELQQEVQRLNRAVFGEARLRIEDLQKRYKCSRVTIWRRIREGSLPRPIQFPGQPVWRLEDVEAAELAGQNPRPVSA